MHSVSIFGTSSDAGKSTVAMALTYWLHKKGVKVAPFKAQNVSNNSMVTDINSGEIAIPQAFSAEAIGLKTTPLFNPVLLKSGGAGKTHLIINGKSVGDRSVREYYRDITSLKPVVKEAFMQLQEAFEVVVAEGAGSPVELNLMHKDLSNIYIATTFKTKIVLVADIQRGGVFASIYGVYNLLPKALKQNVIGVIVNKFQGDMRLFDEGVTIIEKQFGIKVLGVLPFKPFNLGFEDSASLMGYRQDTSKAVIRVGVIALPHMSNFTDFEPLVVDEQIALDFITTPMQAQSCDLVIIPGSKRVVDDMLWLKKEGFEGLIHDTDQYIIAICGGYEMLFETIVDSEAIESENSHTKGFGRLKGEVHFAKEKVVKKGLYKQMGITFRGYEIHNGRVDRAFCVEQNLFGTFVHGLFESDALRYEIFHSINTAYVGYAFEAFKQEAIDAFVEQFALHVDVGYIYDALHV